jgi:vacuolar-type H+-ATPase subunit H
MIHHHNLWGRGFGAQIKPTAPLTAKLKRRAAMTRPASPLQAIKQKELDLRQRVEEARRQAEAKIQAARREAEQTIDQADREGRAEAEALYQRGIEEAQREAEAILAAAHEEAAALHRRATAKLDDAVEQIAELVLPTDSAFA